MKKTAWDAASLQRDNLALPSPFADDLGPEDMEFASSSPTCADAEVPIGHRSVFAGVAPATTRAVPTTARGSPLRPASQSLSPPRVLGMRTARSRSGELTDPCTAAPARFARHSADQARPWPTPQSKEKDFWQAPPERLGPQHIEAYLFHLQGRAPAPAALQGWAPRTFFQLRLGLWKEVYDSPENLRTLQVLLGILSPLLLMRFIRDECDVLRELDAQTAELEDMAQAYRSMRRASAHSPTFYAAGGWLGTQARRLLNLQRRGSGCSGTAMDEGSVAGNGGGTDRSRASSETEHSETGHSQPGSTLSERPADQFLERLMGMGGRAYETVLQLGPGSREKSFPVQMRDTHSLLPGQALHQAYLGVRRLRWRGADTVVLRLDDCFVDPASRRAPNKHYSMLYEVLRDPRVKVLLERVLMPVQDRRSRFFDRLKALQQETDAAHRRLAQALPSSFYAPLPGSPLRQPDAALYAPRTCVIDNYLSGAVSRLAVLLACPELGVAGDQLQLLPRPPGATEREALAMHLAACAAAEAHAGVLLSALPYCERRMLEETQVRVRLLTAAAPA